VEQSFVKIKLVVSYETVLHYATFWSIDKYYPEIG